MTQGEVFRPFIRRWCCAQLCGVSERRHSLACHVRWLLKLRYPDKHVPPGVLIQLARDLGREPMYVYGVAWKAGFWVDHSYVVEHEHSTSHP